MQCGTFFRDVTSIVCFENGINKILRNISIYLSDGMELYCARYLLFIGTFISTPNLTHLIPNWILTN
jgi:hypothetical protein